MSVINYGNMQKGDNNIINDYRGNVSDEIYWKILDNSIAGSNNNDVTGNEIFQQSKSCINKKDKKGLRSVYDKYGVQFITTVLSNIASEQLSSLLSWILL